MLFMIISFWSVQILEGSFLVSSNPREWWNINEMVTVMDRGIDLNLDCSPCSSDVSLKEEIRQAIIHHEILFREQVIYFLFNWRAFYLLLFSVFYECKFIKFIGISRLGNFIGSTGPRNTWCMSFFGENQIYQILTKDLYRYIKDDFLQYFLFSHYLVLLI